MQLIINLIWCFTVISCSSIFLYFLIAYACDWDLKKTSYRVNGVLVPELNLMLFDLNEAITMV